MTSTSEILTSARRMVQSMLPRADYSSAANRKARWEQKVIKELFARWPKANAEVILQSYMTGDPRAIDIFNALGKVLKDETGPHVCPLCQGSGSVAGGLSQVPGGQGGA